MGYPNGEIRARLVKAMGEMKEFTIISLSERANATHGKSYGAIHDFIDNGKVSHVGGVPRTGTRGGNPQKLYAITDKFFSDTPTVKQTKPASKSTKKTLAKEPSKAKVPDESSVVDKIRNLCANLNEVIDVVNQVTGERDTLIDLLKKEEAMRKKFEARAAAFDKLKDVLANV